MIDIDQIVRMENEIEKFLEVYRKNRDLPLILFGAGAAVGYYIDFLQEHKIPIHCIVDGKIGVGEEKRIERIAIKNVEDIFEKFDKANIIISAPKYRKEITENIKQRKSFYNVFSFDATLRIFHGITEEERKLFFITNKDKIVYLWNVLEDDFSKRTLEQIVKGSITANCDYYSDISNDSQYFPDFVMENLGGVFVDIGAYTGDTIYEFQRAVNNKFKKCYAFEPDQRNYDLLCQNFKTDEKILVYKNGVGSQNKHVYFRNEQNSESSHIVQSQETSTSEIEIVCLDSIIKEKVDFIKMDIEGMELEALKGAEKTIKEYKPMLAISIYHKIEDILEIPQYIINLDLGYKLYLRHYWNCNGTDSVLFAI